MIIVNDWSVYKNFTKIEFDCRETSRNRMCAEFLDILQEIRDRWGKPINVTSGYRDPSHSEEVNKKSPGAHAYGVAVDIAIGGKDFIPLMIIAYECGIRRIGIVQKKGKRFLHFDIGDRDLGFPAVGWTY